MIIRHIVAIIKKNISNQQYFYLSTRSGGKVQHRYLGIESDALVQTLLSLEKRGEEIPAKFKTLFWDVDPRKIDLKKNERYVVERILELGTLEATEWLFSVVPQKRVLEVLLTSKKISKRSFHFWWIWFGLDHV